MQVSQVAESENFAVVGGGKARAFEIGHSEQAFKILSDSLYSDKILAVVRELLCNAVDAHIANNIDKPVEIKTSEREFVIRDFGPGIPDDRMIEIYATYFGSTKVNDDKQTGGFGLGSKSPFAYTDHFTVVSCHAGMKRVYALYIADEDVGGAPAIKLMAPPIKTEETGLTVTVPLLEATDRAKFEEKIKKIVNEGGMKATLNGDLLDAIDYSGFENEVLGRLMLTSHRYLSEKVWVRYGNVLYPLGDHAEIREAKEFFTCFNLQHCDRTLILNAPPSSISVTPSREQISYTTRTISTIQKLLKTARHQFTKGFVETAKKETRRVAQSVTANEIGRVNFRWEDERRILINESDLCRCFGAYNVGAQAFREHFYSLSGYRFFDVPILKNYEKDDIWSRIVNQSIRFHHLRARRFRVFDPPMYARCYTQSNTFKINKGADAFQISYRNAVKRIDRVLRGAGIEIRPLFKYDSTVHRFGKTARWGCKNSNKDIFRLMVFPNREVVNSADFNGFFIIEPNLTQEQVDRLIALSAISILTYHTARGDIL